MKFVLDTNIVLSALIKDGLTRKIITGLGFEFFMPSFSLSEILKYRNYVCKKSNISGEKFDLLLNKLFEYIEIVPSSYYKRNMNRAFKLITDKKDVPFLACAMTMQAVIISEDNHFKDQTEIEVFSLVEFIKKFLKER